MPRSIVSSLALSAVFVLGCAQSAAPKAVTSEPPQSDATPAGSSAASESAMAVVIQKGTRENYETESTKMFQSPTAAQIEEQVRAQDWANAQRWPYIGLSRTAANKLGRMSLQGQLGASAPELALRADWAGVEGDQEFLRRSAPLASLDAAIQLLLAFHSNDPKLQSMTEWTSKTAN